MLKLRERPGDFSMIETPDHPERFVDSVLTDPPEGGHFVQFYESESGLAKSAAAFIGSGLGSGLGTIIVATPEHSQAIACELMAQGRNLAEARKREQFLVLDAREVLSKLLVDEAPEPALFNEVIGSLVRKTGNGRSGVRIFGEMVALLAAEGNTSGAVALEELWNALREKETFTLFCAYPLKTFGDAASETDYRHICNKHSLVLPSERYLKESSDERLRQIAELQQKAISLEAEIARRKEVQATLTRRESELTRFVENASMGLHWVGPDGIIQWANRAEYELLGYSAEEYIGRPISDFYEDKQVIEDILRRLSADERLREHEVRLKCKDGSIKTVLIDSCVLWEDGKFIHTQCFTRDITERKKAEQSASHLAAIVEYSDDAIFSTDLDGVITTWNRGAQRHYGYPADEVIGRPVTILIPEDRREEEERMMRRIKGGEATERFETVRRRKDGSLFHVSLTVSPVKDPKGDIIGVSKVGRDITEKVRAKEQMEQVIEERTASLRDALSQMEEFSYSVSHDLRAPLRSIYAYATVLIEDYSAHLDETARGYIEKIQRNSDRMNRLTQDVLSYSRVARAQVRLEEINLESLVKDILHQYEGLQAPAAEVEIQTPLLNVMGHEVTLGQCVANLLNNAVKFVNPGVKPHVRIRTEPRGKKVRVWIEDNGIGIKPEHQGRIFQMFERLHPNGKYEGTGIGLTIVRKAIEKMGGTVGLESDGEHGCHFWFELHAAGPAENDKA